MGKRANEMKMKWEKDLTKVWMIEKKRRRWTFEF
jgi:hypothetical protein